MSEDKERQQAVDRHDGLTRRDALKRGAAVGAALAWGVPVVQSLDVRQAAALAGSTLPDNPSGVVSGNPGTKIQGNGATTLQGQGGSTTTLDGQECEIFFTVDGPWPNPFDIAEDDRTRVRFRFSWPALVHGKVMFGRRLVRRLGEVTVSPTGWGRLWWDGKDESGTQVPPGEYRVVIWTTDPNGCLLRYVGRLRIVE